ncbi:MAG: biotin--[acetyl-CoA-carboxylase] ligase [Saprospiraceae bacterium]|nr:biotin--[acetyl-CoA-carboxylase] ligase [Saprospiraceae bacterium]
MNPIEGTAIYADEQYAGRGQIGSKWDAEAKQNLTVSFIFNPTFLLAKEQFYLSQAVALSIYDLLISYGFSPKETKIKWPNDIYIKDKKIAGILIENILRGVHIQHSIVGIGININQYKFNSDLKNPTSFQIEQQKKFDLEQVFLQLCDALEKWYLVLRSRAFNIIEKTYLNRLYLYQKKHRFFDNERNDYVDGIIEGVTNSGWLLLRTSAGLEEIPLKRINF